MVTEVKRVNFFETQRTSVVANVTDPYRELFVWAVMFARMKLAVIFWKDCPDQIGSALLASMMFKSLAREAEFAGNRQLAVKLIDNAGLVMSSAVVL